MKRVCPLDRVVPKQTKLEARKSTAAEQRKGSASWRSSPAQPSPAERKHASWRGLDPPHTDSDRDRCSDRGDDDHEVRRDAGDAGEQVRGQPRQVAF